MTFKNKLSVVIPAYNEEEGIGGVVKGVKQALGDNSYEIIVVDDGSKDHTSHKAEEAGAKVISHHINRGYGAALKSGIRQAKYELIATLDADGQHDPNDLLRLLEAWDNGYDAVIGARDRHAYQYSSRMPGKRVLQWVAGYLVEVKPADVNSGLRLFRKEQALTYFPILPNGFSFSTTLTLCLLKDAFQVGEIPIQTKPRQGRRSTVSIKDGFRTLMLIIRIAALFNPLKIFIPISAFLFLMGVIYTIVNLVFRGFNVPSGAELLMISSVIIFFFGVLADQLASIRRGG